MSEAFIALGRVLEAHEVRYRARRDILYYKGELASAERDYRALGYFEDCGDYYEQEKLFAERVVSQAVSRKIDAEKRYKAMKLTFLEMYPAYADTFFKHLEKQSKNHRHLSMNT